MSDVRSLLRNERAARKINHPQAQYSPNGLLSCKACRIQVKSDALWQPHLTSPQHINTLKRLAAGLKTQNTASAGTKRKAEDDGGGHEEGLALRKRARADPEETSVDVESAEPSQGPSPPAEAEVGPEEQTAADAPVPKGQKAEPTVDDEEWAAFERDVATPPPEDRSAWTAAIAAGATISAAPMSAAELAAKSREEASVQAKERREAEIEGEKEDAQRRLEEEFDQMDELEERVNRLKEKREALRMQMLDTRQSKSASDQQPEISFEPASAAADEEDDESDYDDWDDWGRL